VIRRRAPFLLAAVLSVALLLPACGGDSGGAAPVSCRKLAQQPDGTSRATIVGRNLAFDVSCLEVRPGTLDLTFENRDAGVAHDLRVTGNGVNRSTDLAKGVTTQRLTVILTEPGRYTFACDPHATMEGTIVVTDPGAAGSGG
jgi:plastocyanin